MKKMSFYEWCSFDRNVRNSICKLSIDIRQDVNAPKEAATLKEWEDYLKSINVPENTIKTLQEAWALYWDQERREPYHNY